jgi:hypothetical protein
MKKAELQTLYRVYVKSHPGVTFEQYKKMMSSLAGYRKYVRNHPACTFEQYIELQADRMRDKEELRRRFV